jgi:hypothetical protein
MVERASDWYFDFFLLLYFIYFIKKNKKITENLFPLNYFYDFHYFLGVGVCVSALVHY